MGSETDGGSLIGIGGVFLHAQDPAGLAAWYRTHFGCRFQEVPATDGPSTWFLEVNAPSSDAPGADLPVTFAIMPLEVDHVAGSSLVTVNLRVADLDETLATLHGAGVPTAAEVIADDGVGVGRFVRLRDPAGHRLELWQHLS
jgi:predicted enzyme related to lactoylglutathione lyase